MDVWPGTERLKKARRQWFRWSIPTKLATLPMLRDLARRQEAWCKGERHPDHVDAAVLVWDELWQAIQRDPAAEKLRSRW